MGRDVKPTRTGRRDGHGRGAVISASLRTFYERGYYGASIRDIAAEADMTAASIYHYFDSKQDILRVVMTGIMQDALASTRSALINAGPTPAEQLSRLVEAWVVFHAERRIEAHVGASELRSLEEAGRHVVIALRDEQEHMFAEVVRRGIENGDFTTPDPLIATRAIITMGRGVSSWYRPDGDMTVEDVAAKYATVALSAVGYHHVLPPAGTNEFSFDVGTGLAIADR